MRIFILRPRILVFLSLRCALNHLKEWNERCTHAKTITCTIKAVQQTQKSNSRWRIKSHLGHVSTFTGDTLPCLLLLSRWEFNNVSTEGKWPGTDLCFSFRCCPTGILFPSDLSLSCNSPSYFVISHQPAKKKKNCSTILIILLVCCSLRHYLVSCGATTFWGFMEAKNSTHCQSRWPWTTEEKQLASLSLH